MTFRGKVQQRTRPMRAQQRRDRFAVANIDALELHTRVRVQRCEVVEIAGVGQLVDDQRFFVRLAEPIDQEIGADKSRAAGNEDHC